MSKENIEKFVQGTLEYSEEYDFCKTLGINPERSRDLADYFTAHVITGRTQEDLKQPRYDLLEVICAEVLGIMSEELNKTKAGTPERAKFLQNRSDQKIKERESELDVKRNAEIGRLPQRYELITPEKERTEEGKQKYMNYMMKRYDETTGKEGRAKVNEQKQQYEAVCAVLNTPFQPVQQQSATPQKPQRPQQPVPEATKTPPPLPPRGSAVRVTSALVNTNARVQAPKTEKQAENQSAVILQLDNYISKLEKDPFTSSSKKAEKSDAVAAFKKYMDNPIDANKMALNKHVAALTENTIMGKPGRLAKIVENHDSNLFNQLKNVKQESEIAPKPPFQPRSTDNLFKL